jgi:hypothetical protein
MKTSEKAMMGCAVLLLSLLVFLLCRCEPQMTVEDHAVTGGELTEQTLCVQHYRDAGQVKIDACRAEVRKLFDNIWIERFEGGIP